MGGGVRSFLGQAQDERGGKAQDKRGVEAQDEREGGRGASGDAFPRGAWERMKMDPRVRGNDIPNPLRAQVPTLRPAPSRACARIL